MADDGNLLLRTRQVMMRKSFKCVKNYYWNAEAEEFRLILVFVLLGEIFECRCDPIRSKCQRIYRMDPIF